MLKKTVKETINEYDEQGNLVKQIIKETDEYDGIYDTITTTNPLQYPNITWANQTSTIRSDG